MRITYPTASEAVDVQSLTQEACIQRGVSTYPPTLQSHS